MLQGGGGGEMSFSIHFNSVTEEASLTSQNEVSRNWCEIKLNYRECDSCTSSSFVWHQLD